MIWSTLAFCAVLFAGAVSAENKYGTATYYDVSGLGENNMNGKSAYTACGHQSTNGEFLFAASKYFFDKHTPDNNPNRNPLCYKPYWVWGNGKGPVKAWLVDRMENDRKTENDIDLTPALFKHLSPSGTLDEGVINIGWNEA